MCGDRGELVVEQLAQLAFGQPELFDGEAEQVVSRSAPVSAFPSTVRQNDVEPALQDLGAVALDLVDLVAPAPQFIAFAGRWWRALTRRGWIAECCGDG